MDRETCQCKCKDARHTGPNCEVCAKRSCNGHGVFDKKTCSCLCEVPFRSSSDCATCDVLECGKNGYFDPRDCKCKCHGGWTGLNCDVCKAPKENPLTGNICAGGKAWDPVDCKCSDTCKRIRCKHGGVQDPITCQCKCNPGSESMDAKRRDIAIQEFKHIVRARFGTSSPVTSAVSNVLVKFVSGNVAVDKALEMLKRYISTSPHEDVLNAYEKFKDKVGNSTDIPAPGPTGDYDVNDQNIMDNVHARISAPSSVSRKVVRKLPNMTSFKSILASLVPSVPSFMETKEEVSMKVVDNTSYWTGKLCEVCNMPDKTPCAEGEVFDLTKCACSHECPKPELQCLNGGKIDEGTCHCKCLPGYGGKVCEYHLDGLTKQTAVPSCKQLLRLNPETPSGGYWIKPKKHTEPFLTRCDMAMDGGGWTQLARIENAKNVNFDSISYMEGVTPSNSGSVKDDFILPCTFLDGLDKTKSLHQFILRVTMGSVRDYFKLVDDQNSNLCDMLTSDDKHLWSANGGGVGTSMPGEKAALANTGWLQPEYSDLSAIKILGGSNETWPAKIDGRKYLSIWGGYEGGCCHYSSNIYPDESGHGVDAGQWNRGFAIHVKEMPYVKPDPSIIDQAAVPSTQMERPTEKKPEETPAQDTDSSPRNLFSSKGSSRLPNMLTKGSPKKEFMNTMFLEGVRQHRNNDAETRSLQMELPWMDAKKAMNLD